MEFNYFGLAAAQLIKDRPQDFIVTDKDVERITQNAVKRCAEMDRLNPRREIPRKEYNQLRETLYNLQQNAKNTEIFYNTCADKVRAFEQRINDLLTRKKAAILANELGNERSLENQVQLIETELIDAKEEFAWSARRSTEAARALKAFDQHERIAELQKELGL